MHGAYVVQIGAQGDRGNLCGRVEEVDSGRSVRFRSGEELLEFMRVRELETVAEQEREQ